MTFTPAMQQYVDIKKQHSDCILFFRIGDFYEVFFEDAAVCSKVLDILLTSKHKDTPNPIPMAGIPYHSLDKYIPKLIHHGYKIAIAEQTTQPIPGKIVEREVTQIITPGTYIQEHKKDSNSLLSLYFGTSLDANSYHIARGDFTLGEYRTKSFSDPAEMQKFILTLKPIEIIFHVDFPDKDIITTPLQQYTQCISSVFDIPVDCAQYINDICMTQTIASFGKSLEDGRLYALGLLLHYIHHTQKTALTNIVRIALHSKDKQVLMDDITIKNLELFSSSYEGSEKYSLIGILDNTKTFGGSRLLRTLLATPINDSKELRQRLDHISYYQGSLHTPEISRLLGHVLDIPKIITHILYKKLLPSHFIKLRTTLGIFFEKQEMLGELVRLGLADETITYVQHLYNYLQQLLKDDNEYKEDIDFVRDGYDQEIDTLRQMAYHSDELLISYQQELVQASGIQNVKLKFVMNQGYFIEITNKDIAQFEEKLLGNADRFALFRRNTLKGGQRYTSPYLDEIQEKILKAKDELGALEFQLLTKAKEKIGSLTTQLYAFANKISWLDVFTSHALLAQDKGYTKPEILPPSCIEIVGGRHPVIEEFLPKDQQFIANDLALGNTDDSSFLHIITGPNMGGKSTYLRQNALIVLMAHCGLFVPAQSAKIGLIDGIFARIGSGDNIAKNQSTFMTEMIEVANILNNATEKSFVIFDELGRGTATYDGLALTKAILEYIALRIQCKTLIATHYHELIQLEHSIAGIKNFSVSVYETNKEVVFMKKIVAGGASKSYGLDVAKLAGIPKAIIERAKENLGNLENTNEQKSPAGAQSEDVLSPLIFGVSSAVDPKFEKIKSMLESYDLNNLTPLQALQLLSKVKDELN